MFANFVKDVYKQYKQSLLPSSVQIVRSYYTQDL